MSSRASGGALAASLITAAIVGFAGGAFFGAQSDGGADPATSETTAPSTPVGETPPDQQTDGTEEPAADGLTLTADPAAVAANERIDLSGAIEPAAEGVALVLQRSVDGGEWETFPLDTQPTTRADGTFSTWVTTGQSGTNAFRVMLADDESVVSNEAEVAVS